MTKTIFLAFVIVVLSFSSLTGIEAAEAQSTMITINADGSINPSTAAIQGGGNTYIANGDIISSITVEKGDIVIDGANHALLGPGSKQNFIAITLKASNVTIMNFHFSGWRAGVYGAYDNNTIANNEFEDNYQAIAVYADDYLIKGNIISGSSDSAILIDGGATRSQGDNNLVTQNQIANNNWAFDILNSNGTTISKNNVTDNAVILTLGTQYANINSAGSHIIFLNNFVNNAQTLNVPFSGPFISSVVPLSPAGKWDNGSAGNYWSDYQSRYPNVTEIGSTGVGDTPYTISQTTTYSDDYANGTHITGTAVLGKAIDRYPLVTPYEISDGTTGVWYPSPSPSMHPPPIQGSSSSSPLSISPPTTQTPSPTPSHSVPESPAWIILLLAVTTAASAVFSKKIVIIKF